MLQADTLINGRYRIARAIGTGGMGSVYAAHDERLGRQVALKLLRADLASDQRSRERFLREAQIAAQLVHPNIVRTYDVGDAPEGPFLVQELLDGRTLDTLLPLPPQRAITIAQAITEALGAIHSQGYVHCDIKPQNVMLVGSAGVERVVLLDFGIARVEGTATTTLIATPHYLAPELAMGSPPSAASDWYALGIVLFQMLADHPPFDGPTLHTIIEQHRTAPLPPLQLAAGGTAQETAALEAIIRKLTAKQPNERYTSAAALHQDLAAVQARAIHSQPTMVVASPGRHASAAPRVAAAPPRSGAEPSKAVAPPPPAIVQPVGSRYNPRIWLLGIPLILALLLGGTALMRGRAGGANANAPATPPPESVTPATPTPNMVFVPNVINLSDTEAQQQLGQVGLIFVLGETVPSEQAANSVVATSPAPGELVAPGTQVVVQVSAGPPPPGEPPDDDDDDDDEKGKGKGKGKKK